MQEAFGGGIQGEVGQLREECPGKDCQHKQGDDVMPIKQTRCCGKFVFYTFSDTGH